MKSTSRNALVNLGVCLLLLAATGDPALADIVIDLGRGPITVHVPDSYDPEVPAPLVMALHGYSGTGAGTASYFQLPSLSEEFGFLYLCPEGMVDSTGRAFWNATDACCDFEDTDVDDSGYLRALIDEVMAQLNVDPWRVHLAGFSNGGFMSYRMACDHADMIASIASLAGATFDDPLACSPDSPVHVLQIHGTSDEVVFYDGGTFDVPYPGAVETVEQWAMFDGCDIDGVPTLPPLDLDGEIPGAETDVFVYDSSCELNGSAELWRINGGFHMPQPTAYFSRAVIEFLLSHSKNALTGVGDGLADASAIVGPVLYRATPNPFNPRTRLRYHLREAAAVDITVYDLAGRPIRNLAVGEQRVAGSHELIWEGRDDTGQRVASGIYVLRLGANGQSAAQKLVLVK